MIKLPSGELIDLEKYAQVTVPDSLSGDVYARLDSGKIVTFYGENGRAFYAAQLARVGKADAAAVKAAMRCPHCLSLSAFCDCKEQNDESTPAD